MLFPLFGVFLLLPTVQHDNYAANDGQANYAHDADDIQTLRGRNEQLQTPTLNCVAIRKDDQLRVRNDGRPHAYRTLTQNWRRCVERLNVVVRTTHADKSIGQLQIVVALLVILRANNDELFVSHVRDHEPVRHANGIVSVDIFTFGLLWVDEERLHEEIVRDDAIVEDHQGGRLRSFVKFLHNHVQAPILVNVHKSYQIARRASSLYDLVQVRVIVLSHIDKLPLSCLLVFLVEQNERVRVLLVRRVSKAKRHGHVWVAVSVEVSHSQPPRHHSRLLGILTVRGLKTEKFDTHRRFIIVN